VESALGTWCDAQNETVRQLTRPPIFNGAEYAGLFMKTVLFLCTGNYYRSRFAEELFNFRASIADLKWTARSRALAIERGTENIGPISPYVVQALDDRGIQAVGLKRCPQQCSVQDLKFADLIIAMKKAEHHPLLLERFAGWEGRVTYWHIHDLDASVPTDTEAFDSLEYQIEALIRELTKGNIFPHKN
jgi:protein-tyrosine phosphatase